jgi:hypothetical protein
VPLAANAAASPARELSLKARAHDLRRAGKAGSGMGRKREETWLKRSSEQNGVGDEENAAMTGQKMDGERTVGGAARSRESDEVQAAGRRERRVAKKAGCLRRPSLAMTAWSWWPPAEAALRRGRRRRMRRTAAGVYESCGAVKGM